MNYLILAQGGIMMNVVNFEGKIYLAKMVKNNESEYSCSYDREVAFYNYEEVLKLDGKTVSKELLDSLRVFTQHFKGTKLPYDLVDSYAPVSLNKVESYEIKVAKKVESFVWD